MSGIQIQALEGLTFSITRGEFLAVVGPSGSGKSTLLNILAGTVEPTTGSITRDADIRVGMVFQGESLFPWRTVRRNIAYSLEVAGAPQSARDIEAQRTCALVGLDPGIFLDKYPRELSGGESRRVSIGMVLAHAANFLLFDEATSQLDYFTRRGIQQTIERLWRERGLTVVYVTHDLDEAILLGDQVLVLDRGAVAKILDIHLPRPRNEQVMKMSAFSAYREEVLQHFGPV